MRETSLAIVPGHYRHADKVAIPFNAEFGCPRFDGFLGKVKRLCGGIFSPQIIPLICLYFYDLADFELEMEDQLEMALSLDQSPLAVSNISICAKLAPHFVSTL